jgi:AcrR family transcriptional regulator
MPTQTFFRLRDEKQESVMRSAIKEFVAHGYTRAKISDIAVGAGVAKGSIFQYFKDKQELFTYCAQWGLATFMKKIEERTDIGDMDVFEFLQNSAPMAGVLAEESELASFMEVAMNEPGLIDESMKSIYEVGNIYMLKAIQNGKRKGSVRTDISDELLLEFFIGVTDRFSKRVTRLYVDMSTGKILQEDALIKERDCMLDFLKKGMGC